MIPAAAEVALPSICASTIVTSIPFLINTYAEVSPTIPAPIITTFFIRYTFFFNKNFYEQFFCTIFFHIMVVKRIQVSKICVYWLKLVYFYIYFYHTMLFYIL